MDSMYILTADGELYHHGTKGMRWGIRRYQTKDGSLTPAGKRRYNKDMEKIKAETKRLKNQQRTDKKISKLEEAMKNLQDLKNKRKGKDNDQDNKEAVETDEQKRERILRAPTAKDVYENRHLFSNKEVGDLYLRLNNEQNIKNLVPKEVDAGKARTEKFFSDLDRATTNITKLAKAYNTVANVYNAFSGRAVSLPKIELDNTKGNKETRRQEKKRFEEEMEKRQKEADEESAAEKAARAEKKAAKAEKKAAKKAAKEETKRQKEMDKYEEYNKQYTEPKGTATSTFRDSEYRNSGGDRTYTNPNESRGLALYNPPANSGSNANSNSNSTTALAVRGQSYANNYIGWGKSYSALPKGKSTSTGKRAIEAWVEDSDGTILTNTDVWKLGDDD